MRIAVAGGTGMVGRHVVDVAREEGHEVVVLSRAAGVDLTEGEGLDVALAGVDVVVDVTSTATQDAQESRRFFDAVTRHLLAAEERAGVGHHVALGIVGSDRATGGYYVGKVHQEQLVESGAVPWTILRATQFHEFAQQLHGQVTLGPFVLVPVMRSEPVAAREVAERLVALAVGRPTGRARDLGGPDVRRMVDMVRAYARQVGDRRRILAVPLPGPLGRGMRDGSLLTRAGADHGTTEFEAWLSTVTSEPRG
ncbi:SDR family oxidoreductase [Aeromicrobium sp. Leaf245]|uniref:SDR family oxidoreductase n=1 Tax=Aeromicrobium sp. Leaf245 TaxID=1736306 RepID=UPI0006FB4FBB|nr:SDR family oxidoreductase [Aeromicrobium sp. Leaf245]KQO41848.1 3-beta hydroxysteroid dehydrogenase [Aeromicrobium sp. Leaf245]